MGITQQEYEMMLRRIKTPMKPDEVKAMFPWITKDIKAAFSLSFTTDEAKLNKTERAYYLYLQALKLPYLGVQNITLKLADDCRLTPDFTFLDENGLITFVDVKGFQREDALLKMKFAARTFRWARFVIVKRIKNGWETTEVRP